tara:strand:+ start:43 stop:621 length:579 start_codon:yes stop_codon:yes gene_type:complete
MNRLLLILILTLSFQSWTKADDISDFEIEGISLGDSALDYFTKEEIIKNKRDFYNSKKFSTSSIESDEYSKFETIQISYKSSDKLFKILDISGVLFMNYNECMKDIKSISLEFDKMFVNTSKVKLDTYKNNDDPYGKSKVSDVYWYFDNKDVIVLACFYVDTKWASESNFKSEFRVSIGTDEFNKFLIEESK